MKHIAFIGKATGAFLLAVFFTLFVEYIGTHFIFKAICSNNIIPENNLGAIYCRHNEIGIFTLAFPISLYLSWELIAILIKKTKKPKSSLRLA